MADNITAPAAGTILATDEIGGVHHPRTKISFGGDGTATDVSDANPLPVELAAGFSTSAKQDALVAAIEAIAPDDAATETTLTEVATRLATIIGHVDGLEGLATALNGYVDGLEALNGTTNTTLTALNGFVDGLEGGQASLLTALGLLLTKDQFEARIPTQGPKAASGSISTTPSTDQDPILDQANGLEKAVTTSSTTMITPPAGCKYVLMDAEATVFFRTDGVAATVGGKASRLIANTPQIIPVTAGTDVTVIGAAATKVYATPLKSR